MLDFAVIGAQKAGTTSLFEHLRGHPELYLPPGKEQPFFSHDEIYAAGWPEFAANTFHDVPKGTRRGAVDPWYMAGSPLRADPDAAAEPYMPGLTERIIPERIHEQLPAVKLIAILRDPVDRCVSHYGMSVLGGGMDPPSFDRVIADLLEPAALERARGRPVSGFVTWGEYGRILDAYYAVFAREQIFVCFTSELEAAPLELMRRLFDFLGVETGFVPPTLGRRYRQGASAPRVGWLRSPSALQKKLIGAPVVRWLWTLVPSDARRRIVLRLREANYRYDMWNRRASSALEASPESLARLRAHYAEDRPRLEELIGGPVPWAT